MNAYFVQHSKQICGTMEMVPGQFGMESTCQPNRDKKLSEQIRAAMGNIQGRIEVKTATQTEEMGFEAPKRNLRLKSDSRRFSFLLISVMETALNDLNGITDNIENGMVCLCKNKNLLEIRFSPGTEAIADGVFSGCTKRISVNCPLR